MGLQLRFNLAVTVVFLVALLVTGLLSQHMLRQNAREEVIRKANLMIETAQAIRSYTVQEVRSNLEHHLDEVFLPQTVPAYAATETLARLPSEYDDYVYKEATLNATNPRNRATDWEADIVQEFQRDRDVTTLIGERDTPRGRMLFIASAMKISNDACLTCHGAPTEAPQSMVALYGNDNGFGWQMGEIVGAQVVSVPMSIPMANAERAFLAFMVSLCAVFVILYVVLNLMLTYMIIRPVTRMSRDANEISTGNFGVPEFPETWRDEIGRLAVSFNRMRRSLEHAIRMID